MKAHRLAAILFAALAGCNKPEPAAPPPFDTGRFDQLEGRLATLEQRLANEKNEGERALVEKLEQLERRLTIVLSDKLADLLRRIELLEKRAARPQAKADAARAAAQGKEKTKLINIWRNLKTGMSKPQIREILGDPRSKKVEGAWEHWFYTGELELGAFVRFNADGELMGWNEPRP